ncbi:MAG: HAMP domain-containing sensor histidine kinase [Anaerolineae bacterium]|nr:HAMP domain-containing histidine kinase [Caldilineales bacterium]MDW8268159.1 HAMP domain-containing sensor histidine kinase [Anaerolineae bacterium]
MIRSVRWRLIGSYVLLTVLSVALVGIVALTLVGRYVEQGERAALQATAEAIAVQAEPLLNPLRLRELRELAQTAAFLGNEEVRIFDARRNLLVMATPNSITDTYVWLSAPVALTVNGETVGAFLLSLPALQPFVEGVLPADDTRLLQMPPETVVTIVRRIEEAWGTRLVFEVGTLGELGRSLANAVPSSPTTATARTVLVPVGSPEQPLGYVELRRTSDLGTEALPTTRRALLLAGVAAAVLAALVGLVVVRGLTAPLAGLAAAAGRMGQGDLTARAPVAGGTELEQLARQFNHMAAQLESSFAHLARERDTLRRFIADASHELRTPITALKNFIELLQGPAADDAAAREEFLRESQAQIARLEWITTNLLDLSRAEAGLVELDRRPVPVADLLESAVAPFRPRALEKEIVLEVKAPTAALVLVGDRTRLELALGNLIDNALRATSAGGRVTVRAEVEATEVRLVVEDTGHGVAPEDQPHIFERFYRGANGGTGLGLAIVRSIAQAHGGRVWLDATGPTGSRFVIAIPRDA